MLLLLPLLLSVVVTDVGTKTKVLVDQPLVLLLLLLLLLVVCWESGGRVDD